MRNEFSVNPQGNPFPIGTWIIPYQESFDKEKVHNLIDDISLRVANR
jgi:hypothetical protein